jgi:hypothetical protein
VTAGTAKDWLDRSRAYEASYPDSYLAHYPDFKLDAEGNVVMSRRDFDRLDEYSGSVPTGVFLGKCWKCRFTDGWFLRWYGWSDDPKHAAINQRKILILEAPDG